MIKLWSFPIDCPISVKVFQDSGFCGLGIWFPRRLSGPGGGSWDLAWAIGLEYNSRWNLLNPSQPLADRHGSPQLPNP